jgi:serine/threonine-protein kinase RsbW
VGERSLELQLRRRARAILCLAASRGGKRTVRKSPADQSIGSIVEAQFSAPPPRSQSQDEADLPVLRASYPAEATSVARARRAVAELAARLGASEQAVAAVRLAVSEAITNAVIHGYRGRPGRILLTATADGDELFVVVQDDGCGLKVPPSVPGLGVGWAVIADACEEFTVLERSNGGAELQMRFALRRAPGGSSPG